MIQPLLRYSPNCFLTSESSKGGILYYLLAGGIVSGSKSISCFMALSGEVPGFSKTSQNSLQITSQHERSVPGTLVLYPPPNISNTPLVLSND